MTEERIAEIKSLVGDGTQGWTYRFVNGEESLDLICTNISRKWTYRVEGRLLGGRPAITSLTILPRDPKNPQPITKETVRSTPIGTVLAKVKSALHAEWHRRVQHLASQSRTHIKEGRSWAADHYRNVAWFCIEAELRGVGPRQVIADHWGVNKSTASRWMAEARRRGYLPEYPVTPSKRETWVEVQQEVDEQIFRKVLAEKVTSACTSSDGNPDAFVQVFISTLFGASEASRKIRATIFMKQLRDIARDSPEGRVGEAIEELLAALAEEMETPMRHHEQSRKMRSRTRDKSSP
ncbi:hypothetical protein JBE04_29740 [Streptomyces sp. PRKS01-29]|nr:hypothetical protein [Streptomyces sabulosicollis]MBI0298532.1 hypothetical protein [Streptomyces sabulosicollis]